MTLIYSFLFAGFICLIGQIILDNSTLTPGHLTSLFTVLGSVLAVFNIYDNIIQKVGMGASLMIINFGNALTNSAYVGFIKEGFLGLLNNLLSSSSLIISSTIIIVFIITLFTKAKD